MTDKKEKEKTVTIPESEYRMLMMCKDIVVSSVNQNVVVVNMTKKVCERLGISEYYDMAYSERSEKSENKRGRPKKEKTVTEG